MIVLQRRGKPGDRGHHVDAARGQRVAQLLVVAHLGGGHAGHVDPAAQVRGHPGFLGQPIKRRDLTVCQQREQLVDRRMVGRNAGRTAFRSIGHISGGRYGLRRAHSRHCSRDRDDQPVRRHRPAMMEADRGVTSQFRKCACTQWARLPQCRARRIGIEKMTESIPKVRTRARVEALTRNDIGRPNANI